MPLAVDLDGTLLATDTLHEGLVAALLHDPAVLRACCGRCCRAAPRSSAGSAARRRPMPPACRCASPFSIGWRHSAPPAASCIWSPRPTSRSPMRWPAHLDIFDSATGSDGTRNLKQQEKAAWLRRALPRWLRLCGRQPRMISMSSPRPRKSCWSMPARGRRRRPPAGGNRGHGRIPAAGFADPRIGSARSGSISGRRTPAFRAAGARSQAG